MPARRPAFLDFVLPKLNGPDVYERMSRLRPGLPVIFTTGYSSESAQIHDLVRRGAVILQKPYTLSLLSIKVRELLDPPVLAKP